MWTLDSLEEELKFRILDCREQLKNLDYPSFFHGGISDDDEDKRILEEYSTKYDKLTTILEYARQLYEPFAIEKARLLEERRIKEYNNIVAL
jgi:hypothetical protein